MGSLIFIIKSFVITVFVILMLQIKIGDRTLEYRVDDMVRRSGIEQPAQYLADGLVRFVRNTWRSLTGTMNNDVSRLLNSRNAPGSRQPDIDLRRSAEYIKEQAEKAKEGIEERLRKEE